MLKYSTIQRVPGTKITMPSKSMAWHLSRSVINGKCYTELQTVRTLTQLIYDISIVKHFLETHLALSNSKFVFSTQKHRVFRKQDSLNK